MKNIAFPIIWVTCDGFVSRCTSYDELITCTYPGFKSGFYNNLILIDTNNKKYLIKYANKIAFIGRLGKSFVSKWLIGTRLCKVDLFFDPVVEQKNLNEIKELLLSSIKKNRDFYNAGGEMGKMILNIKRATDIQQIIESLPNLSDFTSLHDQL